MFLIHAATIEEESLTLELSSQPLSGPDILLPVNRTDINEDSTISLVCTVTNQGRFTWQWTGPQGSIPQQTSDETRTSTAVIPLAPESVGEYTCTVSYHPDTQLESSSTAETFTVRLERKTVYVVSMEYIISLLPQECSLLMRI